MATNRELASRLAFVIDRYVNIMINDPAITSSDHVNLRDQLAREFEAALNGLKQSMESKYVPIENREKLTQSMP